MKTILLLVHDDAGQEARLQAALDVTRIFEGHLVCLDVALMPLLIGDFYGTLGTAELVIQEREAETANRARLEARLSLEDVPWSMIEMSGTLASDLRRAAALADLIIVSRDFDAFPVSGVCGAVGDIVLTCGKPVLAVPQDMRGIDLGGRALIGWDGSLPAHAALQASVPFLQRASGVDLLEISCRSVAAPAENAAAYLSRYGVRPQIIRRGAAKRVADEILAQARLDYAYVVMGGFNHSRFREALFGGVTRTMLEHSPVPLFLAH